MSDENKPDQKQPPNFKTKEGKWYMVKCFKCNRENWAITVAIGKCAWCGDRV